MFTLRIVTFKWPSPVLALSQGYDSPLACQFLFYVYSACCTYAAYSWHWHHTTQKSAYVGKLQIEAQAQRFVVISNTNAKNCIMVDLVINILQTSLRRLGVPLSQTIASKQLHKIIVARLHLILVVSCMPGPLCTKLLHY